MRVFCVLLCFVLSSCKLVRLVNEENIVFKSNHMKLNFNDDALVVKVKIDNKDEKFLFDTGASNTTIFDTTLIKDFSNKERISLFSIKDPNGNISSFYTPTNIETEMFLFNNQLVTVLPGIKNYCSNNNYLHKGIIGSSFFKKSEGKNYLFDFDSLIIKNTNDKLTEKDYFEVKAKFFNNHFAIYLNINGFEEPFLFDTGNTAYPLIIGSDSNIKPINCTEFLGSEGIVASGNVKANSKYSNENDLLISEYKMNTPICFTSRKMDKYNNMGLGFIKYFNWIIDFKNEKAYFKRNNLPFKKQDVIPKYKYLCMIIDKQLKIITKLKSETSYNINDQIISVNGSPVRIENICEMQDLLNKTQDWNTLKLEVITPKK